MNYKESLLAKAVPKQSVRIDPNNKNYTNPRTYGVYEIVDTTNSKRFRYGNHPVRENELIREFENVKQCALFPKREDAKAYSDYLNQ